jgi:hypothetical protein
MNPRSGFFVGLLLRQRRPPCRLASIDLTAQRITQALDVTPDGRSKGPDQGPLQSPCKQGAHQSRTLSPKLMASSGDKEAKWTA